MELNFKNIKNILLIVFCSALIFATIFNFSGVVVLLGKLLTYVSPIIFALCVALVLNIFLTLIETKIFWFMKHSKYKIVKNLQRPLCLFLTYLFAFGLLSLIVLVIIPDISQTVTFIAEKLPTFVVDARAWLIRTLEKWGFADVKVPEINIESLILTLNTYFNGDDNSTDLVNNAIKITENLLGLLSDGLFGIILSIYVLAQKEKIGTFFKRIINSFLPENTANIIHRICSQTYLSFTRFISGQLAEAVILGVLCYVGMLIFGFPNAVIVSLIICVTAIVPVVGAFVGGFAGAFLILITNPIKAVLFLLFLIILQQIETNLIYPRVVGKAVGLPGVIVISAVLLGGNLGGVIGALVSVPLTAVFYTLLKELMDVIDAKKKKATE